MLFPAYLRSANLPSFMRLVQYEDVREGDRLKLEALARAITTPRPGAMRPRTSGSWTSPARGESSSAQGTFDLAQLVEVAARDKVEVRFEGTITLRSRAD